MDPSVKFIESFKEQVKKVSLKNVLTKYPEKIAELNALFNDERFRNGFNVAMNELNIPVSDLKQVQTSDIDSEDSDQSTGEGIKTDAVVPSNHYLVEMLALLKPQLHQFIEYSLELSIGINFLMPAIEDGNNFGVEIQQECIDACINFENDVYQRLQEMYRYYANRANLVTKAIKNPKCEDFRSAIQERDRLFHKFLVMSLSGVRNHYMNLHDLVIKNLNKIQKPKSQLSTDLLY